MRSATRSRGWRRTAGPPVARRSSPPSTPCARARPPAATTPHGSPATVPVPPDPQALQAIAAAAGGQSYTAQDTDRLSAVYEQLGSQLGHKHTKHEITAAFAGGGLALLLLGGLMSLGWFGRLA